MQGAVKSVCELRRVVMLELLQGPAAQIVWHVYVSAPLSYGGSSVLSSMRRQAPATPAAMCNSVCRLVPYLKTLHPKCCSCDCTLQGNRESYYDPANSLLSEVLVNREGIPISLAVIHAAVSAFQSMACLTARLPPVMQLAWLQASAAGCAG